MRLSYNDVLGDRQRHTLAATITTDHRLSSYGQPVVTLDYDDAPLDLTSWILMGYQIEEATQAELDLMRQWLSNLPLALEQPPIKALSQLAATLGAKGGSVTSTAKKKSSRANGRKGGRPRKDK